MLHYSRDQWGKKAEFCYFIRKISFIMSEIRLFQIQALLSIKQVLFLSEKSELNPFKIPLLLHNSAVQNGKKIQFKISDIFSFKDLNLLLRI